MNGSFIDDKEKMNDIFVLSKDEFLNSYSYLTEEDYQSTIDDLWEDFGYIDIDENENILEDWKVFKKGTFREDIWHWFDERTINGIGNRYFN